MCVRVCVCTHACACMSVGVYVSVCMSVSTSKQRAVDRCVECVCARVLYPWYVCVRGCMCANTCMYARMCVCMPSGTVPQMCVLLCKWMYARWLTDIRPCSCVIVISNYAGSKQRHPKCRCRPGWLSRSYPKGCRGERTPRLLRCGCPQGYRLRPRCSDCADTHISEPFGHWWGVTS